MATCPKGHESATADYCDVCGALMPATIGPSWSAASESTAPPSAASGTGGAPSTSQKSGADSPCPICGTAQVGRFCEEDGYDFLLAPPVEPPAPAVERAAPSVGPVTLSGGPAPAGPDAAATGTWQVVLSADRSYFEAVTSVGGADAGSLAFPRFVAERRFTLDREQLLIGRHSRSRGVHPDIDLAGPAEDPGVSHLHALLVAQADGWAVVDLNSANGTYLNDPSSNPIEPHTAVPLCDGDRIYLGAWTSLRLRHSG